MVIKVISRTKALYTCRQNIMYTDVSIRLLKLNKSSINIRKRPKMFQINSSETFGNKL